MKICFFAKGANDGLLDDMSYYSEDLAILGELGHNVVRATRFGDIPWDCDLYFTWWYAWGFMSLCKSLPRRKPNMMVGPIHLHDPSRMGFLERPLLRRWSIRLSLRMADAAVADSQIEYEGIKELRARNPWMAYHCIVAPQNVEPLSRRKPLVLSVGHLDEVVFRRKRFDNVIRAMPFVLEKFPEARFAMVGRQAEGFEKLPELAKSLGVEQSVEFPGRVDNARKAEYLKSARVLAQPTHYEGFGLAQLEAMANGVPVVTTPAGAVPEVVGDCGLYCDKDNPKEQAEQIIKLFADEALWARLSNAGRERAITLFSREERKKKLAEIIAQLT